MSATVDGSEIRRSPPKGCIKPFLNNGIMYHMAVYENSVVSKACCMGGMIRRYVSRYVSEV